jgi:hypothetical protein
VLATGPWNFLNSGGSTHFVHHPKIQESQAEQPYVSSLSRKRWSSILDDIIAASF